MYIETSVTVEDTSNSRHLRRHTSTYTHNHIHIGGQQIHLKETVFIGLSH